MVKITKNEKRLLEAVKAIELEKNKRMIRAEEIQEKSGMSISEVSRVGTNLIQKRLLKRVKKGTYARIKEKPPVQKTEKPKHPISKIEFHIKELERQEEKCDEGINEIEESIKKLEERKKSFFEEKQEIQRKIKGLKYFAKLAKEKPEEAAALIKGIMEIKE